MLSNKSLKLFISALLLFFLASCSSVPLKKMTADGPQDISISIIAGNMNVEKYKAFSDIKVYSIKGEKKLTESKIEMSEFVLNRQSLLVDLKNQATFKYWVTDLEGDVELANMGLPPVGKTLLEVVDKKARVIAVKDYPQETIFYLPKIALPNKPVEPGDSWVFKSIWRSLKTGWPFEIKLNLTLDSWVECGGLRCAYIKFNGAIKLPKNSPLKNATLGSDVTGEFVYAPVGHQFIWTLSNSVETFQTDSKLVKVKSCTASYQVSPNKETEVFAEKIKNMCF
jgi:hypothetical protein